MEPRPPLDVILHILALLPPNDLALSGLLVCKSAAQCLHTRRPHPHPHPNDDRQQPHHPAVVDLSLPLPQHAAYEAILTHARDQLRQLPVHRKLHILCTAATSGCETNLAVALQLLQPYPQHLLVRAPLQQPVHRSGCSIGNSITLEVDVGTVAARAGHAHLLPWLVEHRCPVDPRRTLAAAAQYCDLPGLQIAWNVLRGYPGTNGSSSGSSSNSINSDGDHISTGDVDEEFLNAAAESLTPDALVKLQWLLDGCLPGTAAASHSSSTTTSSGGDAVKGTALLYAGSGCGCCALTLRTAAAACRSGDLWRLQWLHARGCPVASPFVLAAALKHAPLSVAQWIVDHPHSTSCSCACHYPLLPHGESGLTPGSFWYLPCSAAASGEVAKLRWLQQQGVTLGSGAMHQAARSGQLEAVSYLHEECGLRLSPIIMEGAVASGSMDTVSWLLQRGCSLPYTAYWHAACAADAPTVCWLAAAGVPVTHVTLRGLIEDWGTDGGAGGWEEYTGSGHTRSSGSSRWSSSCEERLLQAVRALAAWCGLPLGVLGMRVVAAAARRGHLPLVRWLVQEAGCGMQLEAAVEAAKESGCEALVEWLESPQQGAVRYGTVPRV